MVDRPRIKLGSPLPVTPSRPRAGHYQELLAQFGSQSSAESATKLRRVSSQKVATLQSIEQENPGKISPESDEPVTPEPQPRTSVPISCPINGSETSEDELARSVRPARGAPVQMPQATRGSARIFAKEEELKMEKRKKEREHEGTLRRGTRDRKTRILESDTMPSPPSTKRKAPPPKLDSARNRLRDDIAQRSKAKANSFLVANKDYFLPLLPKNNQVSKLVAAGTVDTIVPYEELTSQPEGVTATMKPYQLSGLSYLVHLYNNGFSGILGDEMGLGKTLQTLSLFQHLEELDQANGVVSEELRPYLVVCPLSVLNSWVNEAQKWVPNLRVLRFHGSVAERARLKRVAQGLEDLRGNETAQSRRRKASRKAGQKASKLTAENESSFKIIVTTYDTFQAEHSWFKHTFLWRYVVLDEGHKIKSSVTQISTSLRNISSEFRLILTGTPLQNNLAEMWALLAWLYPDVFIENTEALFKESFDLNRGKVNRKTMDDARRLLELIMLRRMKDSAGVNLGLPPKEEILLYVPLTPMQRFWYTRLLTRVDNGMLNELFADGKSKEMAALAQDKKEDQLLQRISTLESGASGDKEAWNETKDILRQAVEKEQASSAVKSAWQKLMNLVMQLRKVCSHPYLLPDAAPEPYYFGDHIIRASGKFILLEKLLKHTIFEQGKKVLIFSGFTRTLDYTEDLLSLISDHGVRFKHLRLDGSSSRARRNLDIRLFNQETSDYKVMLLSTRAGGLGINLTSAQDVIFLDEDWNPQITLQAEARAHRIGQTKKVTIYKLCTQGTVEEQMMGRIRKKLYLSAKITESMQNIHGMQATTKPEKSKAGRASLNEDMPQMDTSQLKTLIRRGAQTLSHPDIDATEMVSWNLETMMEKCRDKPADPSDAAQSEEQEEKWLGIMERVECAVFNGKRYQRKLDAEAKANVLPDTISRGDRRKGKNTTVMIDGYAVTKESTNCADWEAVPTMAGKDPRLREPVREKRREFNHEEHCLACFEGLDMGDLVECRSCPRGYHFDCLQPEYQAKVRGFAGFFCPQHRCSECEKTTSDAGGLIFRCRWCPHGFCEDCLDWNKAELIAENLPEFEMLEEPPIPGGFYIKCPTCVQSAGEDEAQAKWMKTLEEDYKNQHDTWLKHRAEYQLQLEIQEKEAASAREEELELAIKRTVVIKDGLPTLGPSPRKRPSYAGMDPLADTKDIPFIFEPTPRKRSSYVGLDLTEDVPSPPSLTDTSLPTPAMSGSRVSTPKFLDVEPPASVNRKKRGSDAGLEEELKKVKKVKKVKLEKQKMATA